MPVPILDVLADVEGCGGDVLLTSEGLKASLCWKRSHGNVLKPRGVVIEGDSGQVVAVLD